MRNLIDIFPQSASLPLVYLKPGELFIAWEPTIITTLLGSCVSVVFYLPNSKATAVCHAMLPYQSNRHSDTPFRYVDSSIEYMLDAIRARHLKRSSIKAKLFGGANVTTKLPSGRNVRESIGQQNIITAREILAKHRIRLIGEKVGGDLGYKLFIQSMTGQVALRNIANTRGYE